MGQRSHTNSFGTVKEELGDLNIAEDLGFMTDEVIELRERTGFPGMNILHLPSLQSWRRKYDSPSFGTKQFVMYTGTHDNNTVLGWYRTKSTIQLVRVFVVMQPERVRIVPHAGAPAPSLLPSVMAIAVRLVRSWMAQLDELPSTSVVTGQANDSGSIDSSRRKQDCWFHYDYRRKQRLEKEVKKAKIIFSLLKLLKTKETPQHESIHEASKRTKRKSILVRKVYCIFMLSSWSVNSCSTILINLGLYDDVKKNCRCW